MYNFKSLKKYYSNLYLKNNQVYINKNISKIIFENYLELWFKMSENHFFNWNFNLVN